MDEYYTTGQPEEPMPSDTDEAGDTGRKRRDKVRTVTDRRSTRLNVASTHLCNSREER